MKTKLSALALALAVAGFAQANDYMTLASATLEKALKSATVHKAKYDEYMTAFTPYKQVLGEWIKFYNRFGKTSLSAEQQKKIGDDPVAKANFFRQFIANPQAKAQMAIFATLLDLPTLASATQEQANLSFATVRRVALEEDYLNALYTFVIAPLLDVQQASVKDRFVSVVQYAEMQNDDRMMAQLTDQAEGVFADVSGDHLKNSQFSTKYTMLSLGYKSGLIRDHFTYGVYVNKSLRGKTASEAGLNAISQKDKAYGLGLYASLEYSDLKLEGLYKFNRHDGDYDHVATIVNTTKVNKTSGIIANERSSALVTGYSQGRGFTASTDLVVRLSYLFKDVVLEDLSLKPYLSYQYSDFSTTRGVTDKQTEFTLRSSKVRAIGLGLTVKHDWEDLHLAGDLFAAHITSLGMPTYDLSRIKNVTIAKLLETDLLDEETYKLPETRVTKNETEYHLGARLGVTYDFNKHHRIKASGAYHYYTNSKYKGFSYQLAYRYRF